MELEQPNTLFQKIKTVIRRFWFLINIVLVLFLLLSYLAVYISPAKVWFLALIGLAFPYLALLNILFLFSWLLRGRKEVLLSLCALLLGWNHHVSILQIPVKKALDFSLSEEEQKAAKIKILTYNCRSFNVFEWNKNKATRDQIIDFIKKEKPDIICFQEYFVEVEKKDKKRKIFDPEKLLSQWPNHYFSLSKIPNGRFGVAIFSRFPIVHSGAFKFKKSENLTIFADLKIGNDTIRLYNNHLQSYRFDKNDYALVDSFNNGTREQHVNGVMRIGSRLKQAFIQRSIQTDTVAAHAAKSPYPIIICGDFNDTPNSYTYQRMKGNCKDAFMEAGWGISNTYAGNFPSFRIDYILYSPIFKAINYQSPRVKYSDHYPVISILIKRK